MVFVGHKDLAAERPEALRHYSWPLIFGVTKAQILNENGGGSSRVNTPYVTTPACHDHVEAECALMVERNPTVVVSTACHRRKRRDDSGVGDRIDLRIAVFAHVHFAGRSRYACGRRGKGKECWSGGVKES